MTPKIITCESKKFVGLNMTMSLVNNKTADLWKSFMPRRNEIVNTINNDVISLQEYNYDYFKQFNPSKEFKKWALVEVESYDIIPHGMERFDLVNGLYAVFHYKGSSNDSSIFQYIFQTWLPSSEYYLDSRPHFEVLGEKYKNNDENSEEDIWIPIKLK